MNITDVKIRRIYPEGRMRAVVSATIENAVVIHDIKVIELEGKTFIAMPSRKDEEGRFKDIVHPISAAARQQLEERILQEYRQALNQVRPPME